MNSILERVNQACWYVRRLNQQSISFKKLVGATRKSFKEFDIDSFIKTKKDKTLGSSEFYVNAYYDPEDDFNQDTPIEIIVYHNFLDTDLFNDTQITDFLIQIYDATVHEFRHQIQSQKRGYATFSNHDQSPYEIYLTDPDELDAYAVSIAIEILRAMNRERAMRCMTRLSILSKMKIDAQYVSPNLKAYIDHFGICNLTKRLAKKVYKNLDSLDKNQIFM
jgi:hypothetical protein